MNTVVFESSSHRDLTEQQMSDLEVYRSGYGLTLSCRLCGRVKPLGGGKHSLAELIDEGMGHAEGCPL